MRTTLRAFVAAAAIVIAPSAMATDIIVITHGQAIDPQWSVVKNGVDEAAKETGINVTYRAPETFDMIAMKQLIEAAIIQEPDGIVVSIPDSDALGPSILRAVNAGIPVISMNSGAEISATLGARLHVGQDEYEAGKVAGEELAAMGGTVAICVNQEVGNVALDHRCDGFAEGFGGEVTVVPTNTDPSEVEAKIKATLEANPDIDTIIGLVASLVGEPAVRAVDSVGRTGEINVASFDVSAGFLEDVAEGKAAFAVDQQQFLQGYLPVMFLALNAKYGLLPSGDVPSGPNLITAETAQDAIELSARGYR
ncbi:sugar ABC transporter substrate-binding protein [Pseudovibrio japonicus]|uniref:Sugar ABC transporter substrate-binding protein n=1 Tax=Pseudovibrio japonicus TaxID=366534 RepID=A0ABQ3E192_9HYPH|nr:sugar ABC transporter substrate-binding protein [Pseudovibrio japonicus]GHB20219.1 sugar ABC transporter substrate-binding protein [Pseudovibrio japonicus]